MVNIDLAQMPEALALTKGKATLEAVLPERPNWVLLS